MQFEPGEWFGICSGTLIEEDIIRTAAHCTDFLMEVGDDGLGPDDLRLTFGPSSRRHLDAVRGPICSIVVHPELVRRARVPRQLEARLCLASPAEDIALVFLATAVAGVEPSPVHGEPPLPRPST